MPKTQDDRLLAQVLHDGPHHAETLLTGVANEFSGRVPAKKVFGLHLSKTTSFLVVHIAQHRVAAADKSNVLCLLVSILDQMSNKSAISTGGAIPKRLCTERQRNLA